MIGTTTQGTQTVDDALRTAHRQAYRLSEKELVDYLKAHLGRPLIAHVTRTLDANNVSRWASGRARPDRAVWERLRTLATLHAAVTAIIGSAASAAQWFSGANPDLDFKMPADELRDRHDAAVFSAVRNLAMGEPVDVERDMDSNVTQSTQAAVFHEQLFIERHDVVAGTIGTDDTIRIPLSREEIRVEKRIVVTEEVDIGRNAVGGVEHVTDTIGHDVDEPSETLWRTRP